MDISDNLGEIAYPGQKVRITRTIILVEEMVVSHYSGDEGISVEEVISDISGERSIRRVLDNSGVCYNPIIEDITVDSVELL